MSNILRFLGMVVILLAVVVAAALVQPEWARDLGLQQGIETALAYRPLWLQDPHQEPGPQARALDQRYLAKTCISADLLEGRLTLFEAAAMFGRLNAEDPVLLASPDRPGSSEEERLCWQVIGYAEMHLRSRRLDEKEVSTRLKEDLRRHMEMYGKVLLPEARAVN